jgi:hypothetical protein
VGITVETKAWRDPLTPSSLQPSANQTLIKFSTHDCSACQFMSGFDERVAEEMGLAFLDVNMKNPTTYRAYRRFLLSHHPGTHEISLPTYLLVRDPEGDFSVCGEIVGAMQEEVFRNRVRAFVVGDVPVGSKPADQKPHG